MGDVIDAKKRFLSAEDILSIEDIQTTDVEVPEWGGTIRLRALCGADAVKYVQGLGQEKTQSAIKLVVMCAVDEDGAPLFTEDQIDRLQKKSLKALMRVQTEALKISGLLPDEANKAKNA